MTERALMIDAIKGAAPSASMRLLDMLTKVGLAEWCGNQHNPAWRIREDALAKLDDFALRQLYRDLKGSPS
jgi:hypothetical protein